LKVLNLYAGIGGNRKLWKNCDVTAVEINPAIAAIYCDLFPRDNVILADAHEFLLQHHYNFDFIWSSPPCPTHSKFNFLQKVKGVKQKFPDMKLYEEIIFLQYNAKCNWVVENVKSYYDPLIKPQETARHYFWSNFKIEYNGINKKIRNDKGFTLKKKMLEKGILIKDFHGLKTDKRTLLNNAIEPELGLSIFEASKAAKH